MTHKANRSECPARPLSGAWRSNRRATSRRMQPRTLSQTILALVPLLLLTAAAVPAASQSSLPQERSFAQAYLHYSVGRLLESAGGLPDAMVQYRRAEALDPGNCEIESALARTMYAMGNDDEALRRGMIAVRECPDDVEALALTGEILLRRNSAARAESLLSAVALADEPPRHIATLYGQALLSSGQIEEGEAYLRERALVDSLDPDVASLRGRALLLMGQPEEAADELARAARLDPRNLSVLRMLSRLLIALERPEEGVRILELLVREERPLEPEYISLAAGYSMMGESEMAHAAIDSAMARFGETAGLLRARGATYYGEGDYDSAVEAYEKLLEVEEDSAVALNFIAYTLADDGRDLEHAMDYARRAVALEPENPLFRDTLAWVHHRLGENEEAKEQLELAVEAGVESAVVFEHLGDVLKALGLEEEAIEAWKEALRLAPDSETTLRRLEEADALSPTEPEESE